MRFEVVKIHWNAAVRKRKDLFEGVLRSKDKPVFGADDCSSDARVFFKKGAEQSVGLCRGLQPFSIGRVCDNKCWMEGEI